MKSAVRSIYFLLVIAILMMITVASEEWIQGVSFDGGIDKVESRKTSSHS